MPLFRKAEPEPVAGGGKDVVRAMVRNRTRTPGAMSLVREELHVSNDAISAFGGGADNLTPEQINRVLVYFSWNATYDPSADLLVSKAAKATSMGAGPPIGSGGLNVQPGLEPRVPGKFHYGPPGPAFSAKDPPPAKAGAGWPSGPGWA
jgi:hypothetical protein